MPPSGPRGDSPWGRRDYYPLDEGRSGSSDTVDTRTFSVQPRIWMDLTPNASIRHRHVDFNVVYHTDSDGLRVTAYNEGRGIKISIYGDSFAFGVGLEDRETLASSLSKMLPLARVRNVGVNGYAPDQYYLRFRKDVEEPKNRPDLAIFVIFPGNDLYEINYPYKETKEKGKIRTKPFLAKRKDGYDFIFPQKEIFQRNQDNSYRTHKIGILSLLKKSEFLKYVYERILLVPQLSFLTELISNFNASYVRKDSINAGLGRFQFCLEQIERSGIPAIYMLVPSKALWKGITLGGYEDTAYRKAKNLLVKKRVPVIDVLSFLPKEDGYYWPHDGHWTGKATKFTAKVLLRKITSLNLLPSLDASLK